MLNASLVRYKNAIPDESSRALARERVSARRSSGTSLAGFSLPSLWPARHQKFVKNRDEGWLEKKKIPLPRRHCRWCCCCCCRCCCCWRRVRWMSTDELRTSLNFFDHAAYHRNLICTHMRACIRTRIHIQYIRHCKGSHNRYRLPLPIKLTSRRRSKNRAS